MGKLTQSGGGRGKARAPLGRGNNGINKTINQAGVLSLEGNFGKSSLKKGYTSQDEPRHWQRGGEGVLSDTYSPGASGTV